jgi:hypothetical protein
MNDAPSPPSSPPPLRRGRPPSWISSARAIFSRADLKNCQFVLGPWLESLHPRTLERLVEDLERYAQDAVAEKEAEALVLVVMAILAREMPDAERFFDENEIFDAFNRLAVYASIEHDRRDGLVAIEGVPALSADNGVKIAALEGLADALAASGDGTQQ